MNIPSIQTLLKNQSKNIAIALLVICGLGVTSLSTRNSSQLSLFRGSQPITAQNASTAWIADSNNPFRSQIPHAHIAKLDILVVAILKKGVTMTNEQFGNYLKSLSVGMVSLAKSPTYVKDTEVKNILNFLVHEIDATVIAMNKPDSSTNVIGEIADLISATPTEVSTSSQSSSPSEETPASSLQNIPVKYTTAVGGALQADCWSLQKLQLNPQTNAQIIGLVQAANQYGNLDFLYCTVRGGQPHLYAIKENRTCMPSGDTDCYSNAQMQHSGTPAPRESPQSFSSPSENSRTQTTFGIFYSGWHCPVLKYTKQYTGSDILYTSDVSHNNIGWFHFWGKPKLGHYCLAEREDVLRQHAIWLKDAGIEYIVFDATNHAYLDNRSTQTTEMVIDPFKKLLEVWSTIPGAPKVVPWVPVVQGGDVYGEMQKILDQYPAMKFQFKGKPLFIVTGDESRFIPDTTAISTLEQTYTVRTMWGLQNGKNLQKWSFLEQNGLNGIRNNEQINVSTAYQQTHITESTGVGKKNGETFKTQFATVFANPGVDTVLISSWNEWMGQKFVIDGKISYTDSFDEDKNRDIEPQEGGKGSFYYDLMKKCIASYKSGGNSCE